MKVFATEYAVGKTVFSSFVHAQNRKTAELYIATRGIGETITGVLVGNQNFDPCPLPSNLYQLRKLIQCAHCLTFYAWIAGHYLDMHDQMLRDDGILHEILHEAEHPADHQFKPMLFDRLGDLERLIPGLKGFDQRAFDAVVTVR